MHPTAIPHSGILLTADLARLGNEARQVQRSARSGAVHRVRRGAYVDRTDWEAADARGRHILQLRAVHATRRTPAVSSYISAAALHDLPILGSWPAAAHVSSLAPGHSKNGVVQHLARPGTRVVMVDGLACTSLVDTLADLALSADFTSATVSLDHALHAAALAALPPGEWILPGSVAGATAASQLPDAVRATLESSAPSRGLRRALRTLDLATHLSDSPGESVSRCNIHLLGFPAPELQHPFHDYLGRIGWGWATATDLRALYNKLTNAGLRPLPAHPTLL